MKPREPGLELDSIYNVDCLEGLRKMNGRSIDLVVTSPPYDNMRSYGGAADGWCFDTFMPIADELARVLKTGGVIVWVIGDETHNYSESGSSFRQVLYFMDHCGLKLFDTMIWEKTCNGCLGSKTRYLQNFEYMFILSKGRPKAFNPIEDRVNVKGVSKNRVNNYLIEGKGIQHDYMAKEMGRRTNIWKYKPAQMSEHPAPFPYQLAEDHILSWSNEGDIVLDPFIGSGTTALACINNNRRYIGMELNSEYCDMMEKVLGKPTIYMK